MKRGGGGFTLIEMMVVLVIISILAGLVFKMMSLAGGSNEKAVTRSNLEKLAHAIEAYRAEFGTYPPVPVDPGDGTQWTGYEWAFQRPENEGPTSGWGMTTATAAQIMNASKNKNLYGTEDGQVIVFRFGLASFFFPRFDPGRGYLWWSKKNGCPFLNDTIDGYQSPKGEKGEDLCINQWSAYNNRLQIVDDPRNIRALQRILPLIDAKLNVWKDGSGKLRWSVGEWGIAVPPHASGEARRFGDTEFFNAEILFQDGWGSDLHYESLPPYNSFRLWAVSPDGEYIYAGQE